MTTGVNVSDLEHLSPLDHFPDDHFICVVYGVRRSGKTTLLRQLVYDLYPRMKDFKVYVLCSTARFNTTSYDWVPPKCIYNETSDIQKVVGDLLNSQKEKLEKLAKSGKLKPAGVSGQGGAKKDKGKSEKPGQKRSAASHVMNQQDKKAKEETTGKTENALTGDDENDDEVPDILIIMDDVCSEDSIRFSSAMGTVAMNGRQYRISVIILSQMVAGSGSIPPRVRTQVGYPPPAR